MRFVDTNVLLYSIAIDPSDREKRDVARELLTARDLALSTQVLQEFYVQATRTNREDPLTHEEAADLVSAFARFPVQATTLALVQAAVATCRRYRVSYWDAAIIEAARMLGCEYVLSEDLNHGQDYDGTTVINPFL